MAWIARLTQSLGTRGDQELSALVVLGHDVVVHDDVVDVELRQLVLHLELDDLVDLRRGQRRGG